MVTERIGTKVRISSPVKTEFEIETPNRKLAVALALERGKSRYPNKNWDKPIIATAEYKYKEISW